MSAPETAHWPEDHEPSQWRYKLGCRHADCRKIAVAKVMASTARARVRALADPSLIPHGTVSGYGHWGCRCAPCSEAGRMARAASRARRKQRDGEPLTGWDAEVLAYCESRKAAAA